MTFDGALMDHNERWTAPHFKGLDVLHQQLIVFCRSAVHIRITQNDLLVGFVAAATTVNGLVSGEP